MNDRPDSLAISGVVRVSNNSTKARLQKLEEANDINDEPDDNIIIYPNTPGEPERSIRRFKERYPDYDGAIIVLPEKEKDEAD